MPKVQSFPEAKRGFCMKDLSVCLSSFLFFSKKTSAESLTIFKNKLQCSENFSLKMGMPKKEKPAIIKRFNAHQFY
jgi:hypothetical protein